MRNFSREEHAVNRQPVKLDRLPVVDVDDFGLPVKKSREGHASVIGGEDGDKEHIVSVSEHDTGVEQHNETPAFRDRSCSAGGTEERSQSTVATRGRSGSETVHENDHHRALAVVSHDGSRTLSESIGTANEGNLAGSRSSIDDDIQARPKPMASDTDQRRSRSETMSKVIETIGSNRASGGVSEWSHQALAPKKEELLEEKEQEWQDMPALGEYDIYDDDGRLVAKGNQESGDEGDQGGASKGYTRVQIDDDAKSTTSMDENTNYLFKDKGNNLLDEDEQARDPLAQMQATKDMLTEGQRIAYVGVARLAMIQLLNGLNNFCSENKQVKRDVASALESMKMWSQKMMVRLYGHMDIDAAGEWYP